MIETTYTEHDAEHADVGPAKGDSGRKRIAILTIAVISACFLAGCDSDDSYRDTLNSGLNKYYNGQNMSRSEYNAVKSYNNWKSKQGSKSYSDWGG